MPTATENDIEWEEDPLVFIFNDEIPGKVQMHTRRLDFKEWIKIDKTYPEQMALKKELWKIHENDIFVSNPDEETSEMKWELFEMIADHLPKRFPNIFEKLEGCIYNKVLKTSVSTERSGNKDPLFRAAELTQEDWVIIRWDEKEQGYVLTAGIVYFPMRWSLQEKFNKGIAGIHVPVKAFMEHLVTRVYDLFKKMPPDAPIWRANWAVFNDLTGPLDLFTPDGHTDRNDANHVTQFGPNTGKELTFRAEYQTLVKLPKTKCIVFGIRTYQRYLDEFEHFPTSDVQGLVKAIQTLDKEFVIYKGSEFWQDAAIEYLSGILNARKNAEKSFLQKYWVLPLLSVAVIAGGVALRMRLKN